MRLALVPLALLVVAPAAYFAARLGWLRQRGARIAFAAGSVALLAAFFPAGGADFGDLKRLDLYLAAAAATVLWLRSRSLCRLTEPRRALACFGSLAAAALVVYLNFFSFHGARTYLHLHDVAHYYLGSKYFSELGYRHLYVAMLRAEAELTGDRFYALEARDLDSNALADIRALLRSSEAVKERFEPARWDAFRKDVDLFRSSLGRQWGDVLKDHGFNPTPFWALVGGALANLVPPGSHAGILALCLLDPLLELATVAAVAATFGVETMLVCVLYFCVFFGASFGWIGGAYLRTASFAALLGAACLLERRRHAGAGALLAFASLLRVFPAVFLVPLAFKAASGLRRDGRLPPGHAPLFTAFAATLFVGVAATALGGRGLGAWREFRDKIQLHTEVLATNNVGLPSAAAWFGAADGETPEKHAQEVARRRRLHLVVLAVAFVPALWFVSRRSRQSSDAEALSLGLWLLLAGIDLASYYTTIFLLLVLAHRRDPGKLALLFVAEAASYTLFLFETNELTLYVERSFVLVYLLLALHFDAIRSELAGFRPHRTASPTYSGIS